MSFTDPGSMHDAFAAAMADQDVEALLDLYEPGAITALPDGSRIADREARRGMFAGLLASGAAMDGTQRLVLIAGDLALTSTTYEQGTQAGDEPTTVQTAEVARRQPDGSWRVVIDAPAFS